MKTKFIWLILAALVLVPMTAMAKAKAKTPKPLTTIGSSEKASRNAIGLFNRNKANKKLYFVNGQVSAVSPTSISVSVTYKNVSASQENATTFSVEPVATTFSIEPIGVTTKTYIFAVDENTIILRKFKARTGINEVAVGDKVMIWATKMTDGTAKLIWDKSIWFASTSGKVSALDTTAKTFTLTITKHRVEYTTTVKWDDVTTVWQGDTAKAITDLANGQVVKIQGSWNSVGKYLYAKKIFLPTI